MTLRPSATSRADHSRITRISSAPRAASELVAEYWRSAGIFTMLVRRTMLVRYSQTAIGIAWAMLQPLALMLVFSLFFGLLVRVPSDGIPYPLFFCVGLWVWQFAGQAVAQGSTAVIANDHIVSKVYFPRAMLPAAAVAVAMVDMVAAAPALAAVLVAYGSVPDPLGVLVFLGALIALCMLLLGLALWLSALQAFYRDVAYLVPFSLQIWMFTSPIIYPTSIVPDVWRAFYGLNPMVAVVEAARSAFAGGPLPGSATLLPAFAVSITSLLAGHRYFRLREAQLADVV